MVTTMEPARRTRRPVDPLQREHGERYARELRDDEEWRRFVRLHTSAWEKPGDVLRTATKAVQGLTEYTPVGERKALILDAVRKRRAAQTRKALRRIDFVVQPMVWSAGYGCGVYRDFH